MNLGTRLRTATTISLAVVTLALAPRIASSQWNPAAAFPAGPTDASAAFVIDDVAYVTGGLSSQALYAFDRTAASWTKASDIPGGLPRPWAFAFSHDGKGYIGGGAFDGGVTDQFYEFDPATKEWTPLSPYAGGGRDGCFGFVIGDKAYVGGGFDGQLIVADVWEYDFATDTWTSLGTWPGGPTIFPSWFVLGGKGYVVGGQGQTELGVLYAFDPTTGQWSRKADFPGAARQAGMGFAFDGTGYYGGGMAGYVETFQDFWAYNPGSDSWSKVDDDYPSERSAWGVAFAFDDIAYVGTGAGFGDNTLELTDNIYAFGAAQEAVPTAIYSVSALDFGDVAVGASKTMIVGVTPLNSAGLEVSSVELAFGGKEIGYSYETSQPLPASLAFGDALVIEVTFEPGSAGNANSSMQVTTNDAAQANEQIPLTAVGVEAPMPTAIYDVQEIDFGNVGVGDGLSKYCRITPANAAGLTIEGVDIASGGPALGFHHFVDEPLPVTLAFGDTLAVRVTFEPSEIGDASSALTVETNDPSAPMVSIPLSGTGSEISSVDDVMAGSASGAHLQISPNPARDRFTVAYNMARPGSATIEIIDGTGRIVATRETGHVAAGPTTLTFNTDRFPAGMYVIRIIVGGHPIESQTTIVRR
jgi:N-acetylneuraminic acid mutarotase